MANATLAYLWKKIKWTLSYTKQSINMGAIQRLVHIGMS